ncbi:MAG TPA: ATP-binding protein [Euryarchaeota archaeon]|nr:ATP-binding protein [Euryarchaeota archaeon]
MSFQSIAIPHNDVLEGTLTMDVFAANLWDVFTGEAHEEYKNPNLFFKRTYETDGLKKLLSVSKRRLEGKGGDPVIQLQTPFGGGKTHSLIALYHKARECGAKTVVIVGTHLDPKEDRMWELIERQLEGKTELLAGEIPPGSDKLKRILKNNQPVLILMDEVLEYLTRASGIKVGDSNLAEQTLAFLQELTEAVRSLDKSMMVVTLPSSAMEHYGDKGEELFQRTQRLLGRMEKVYSPVRDEEVEEIVRKRLFDRIHLDKAEEVIDEFLNYLEEEGLISDSSERLEYRKRFLRSYPFQPEVIEILYKRWGTFPKFQRTRGVLRLLSLLIREYLGSSKQFLRISDFPLWREEIREELIKHIGNEYEGVLAADITSENSNSKKIDSEIGKSYIGYKLGTKAAITVFMYSFSGGKDKGATAKEVKISCGEAGIPSSVLVEVLDKLKDESFYMRYDGGKYFFSSRANLNRIILDRVESIREENVREVMKRYLRIGLGGVMECYVWPKDTKEVGDSKKFKLIVMEERNEEKCMEILNYYGERQRIYRNTVFFLCPKESERVTTEKLIKEYLACKSIEEDKNIILDAADRIEIEKKRRRLMKEDLPHQVRNLYRIILVPSGDGFKEIDLGIPTNNRKIDEEVFEKLKVEEEILDGISPKLILEKYLKEKDYVRTLDIWESTLRVPGEVRLANREILAEGIINGVESRCFGLGTEEKGNPLCKHFGKRPNVTFRENEILLRKEMCEIRSIKTPVRKARKDRGIEIKRKERGEVIQKSEEIREIELTLTLPFIGGKMADLIRVFNFLKTKFDNLEMTIDLRASSGGISKRDYENKVKEALIQIGELKIEREKTNNRVSEN